MFNEKSFKITIVFTKIRRYLFIFFFVILGLVGAYFASEVLTEIVRLPVSVANTIMIATGVIIFVVAFILTSNLNFKIQQAYLEMKLLKKMDVISYKLDKLLENSGISISDELNREMQIISNDKALMKQDKMNNKKKRTKKLELPIKLRKFSRSKIINLFLIINQKKRKIS